MNEYHKIGIQTFSIIIRIMIQLQFAWRSLAQDELSKTVIYAKEHAKILNHINICPPLSYQLILSKGTCLVGQLLRVDVFSIDFPLCKYYWRIDRQYLKYDDAITEKCRSYQWISYIHLMSRILFLYWFAQRISISYILILLEGDRLFMERCIENSNDWIVQSFSYKMFSRKNHRFSS